MATATQTALPARTVGLLSLWHLLSLDAPTVAALWTWFIARASGVELPMASPASMFLAVWIVYAADRLLDVRRANDSGILAGLEARHHFHHQRRRAFAATIAVASVALGSLLPLLDAAALRLYMLEGALLAAWFLVLHATRSAHRLPKEIAVGIFFSAAVFIPTIARVPALRVELAPAALLFALLCVLNCLFIYAWEHPDTTGVRSDPLDTAQPPHPTTRFALRYLSELALTCLCAGAGLVIIGKGAVPAIALSCMLSTFILPLLHRNRTHLTRIRLRAAADVALLTPVVTLPVLQLFSR